MTRTPPQAWPVPALTVPQRHTTRKRQPSGFEKLRESLAELVSLLTTMRSQYRAAERKIAAARAVNANIEQAFRDRTGIDPVAELAKYKERMHVLEDRIVECVAAFAFTSVFTPAQQEALLRFAQRHESDVTPVLRIEPGAIVVNVEAPAKAGVDLIRDKHSGLILGTRPAKA